MSTQCYSFKVGNIDCAVLLDGTSILGSQGMMKRFPGATEAEYRQAYTDVGLSLDDADSSLNILLMKIGSEIVLVDTGEGGKPRGGHLMENMSALGVDPQAITLVVITHAHGDHVQGLLTDAHEAVFPNATYIISKTELAYWQGRLATNASMSADQRPILAMLEEKGLRLINMDEQIIPGLTAVPIPGHTPGQIAVLAESENHKLIHVADMLHSPMQFAHPEWSPSFDADTSVSVPSRRNTLGRAADENMLMLFYHLTFPGLGWVKRSSNAFTWEWLKP